MAIVITIAMSIRSGLAFKGNHPIRSLAVFFCYLWKQKMRLDSQECPLINCLPPSHFLMSPCEKVIVFVIPRPRSFLLEP